MKIEDCPKFLGCSAPVCPLYEHWRQTAHYNGERACFFLLEYSKHRFQGEYGAGIADEHLGQVAGVYSALFALDQPGWSALRHALTRASKTGSRLLRQPPGREPGKGVALE